MAKLAEIWSRAQRLNSLTEELDAVMAKIRANRQYSRLLVAHLDEILASQDAIGSHTPILPPDWRTSGGG